MRQVFIINQQSCLAYIVYIYYISINSTYPYSCRSIQIWSASFSPIPKNPPKYHTQGAEITQKIAHLSTFIIIYHNLSWFIIIYHHLSWFIIIYHDLSTFPDLFPAHLRQLRQVVLRRRASPGHQRAVALERHEALAGHDAVHLPELRLAVNPSVPVSMDWFTLW